MAKSLDTKLLDLTVNNAARMEFHLRRVVIQQPDSTIFEDYSPIILEWSPFRYAHLRPGRIAGSTFR